MQNAAVFASIPSPTSGQFDLPGPLPAVHAYGLTLLVAIIAAVLMMSWRWGTRTGRATPTCPARAVWGVAAGHHRRAALPRHHVLERRARPEVEGRLPGLGGRPRGLGRDPLRRPRGAWVIRRAGESVLRAIDAVAPALLLAQAIGRLGNWWNQELYGKPTDLPWGLEIDDAHNQDYPPGTTFHPTFLYEALWNLSASASAARRPERWRIRPPALFSLYVAWYTFGRFLLEQLRVDPSGMFWGMRTNAWVSLVLFIASSLFFIYWQLYDGKLPKPGFRRAPAETKRPAMAVPRGRR